MSVFTYRLRAAKGLESTLIKELRWHLGISSAQIKVIPGRKAIQVQGKQETMFKLLSSSRILEALQIKVGPTF